MINIDYENFRCFNHIQNIGLFKTAQLCQFEINHEFYLSLKTKFNTDNNYKRIDKKVVENQCFWIENYFDEKNIIPIYDVKFLEN